MVAGPKCGGGSSARRGLRARQPAEPRRRARRPRSPARRAAAGSGRGLDRGQRSAAGGVDARDHGRDRDGLALLHEDLDDRAGGRGRHLGVDLVGRDLDDRLVGLDPVADLLRPAADRAFRDADAHLGHDHVYEASDCHSARSSFRSRTQYAARRSIACTTSSTWGMNAFSSGGENGTGRVRRRHPHHRRVEILEALLADRRRDLGAEAGRARVLVQHEQLAGARDGGEHRLAIPRDDRAQVDHLDRRAVLGRHGGRGLVGRVDHRAPRHDRQVGAGAVHAGLAERRRVVGVGHLALDAAVQVLVLEVEHRVRVADRLDQEALGVLGRGRADQLQAGDVRERALGVLRVERAAGEAAAGGAADDERQRGAGAVVLLGGHRHEVVPRARDEVGELHLGDGPQAHQRGAGAGADDGGLGQRRVEHAPRPELGLEALGDLEGAAVDADVLADHEHALVAAHLLAEAVRDRLQIGLDRHPLPVMRGVEIFRRRPRRRRRWWQGRGAGSVPRGGGRRPAAP